MFLFELTRCCDEGYDGAVELFQGNSRLDVARFILKEIQSFINHNDADTISSYINYKSLSSNVTSSKGYKYCNTVTSIQLERESESGSEWNSRMMWVEKLKTMTPEKLIQIFDESCVDGDSSFQVNIHQYDMRTIISV